MLKARVLLGTVFIVAVVALLFVDDYLRNEYAIPFAPVFCGLTLLVTAMGLYELTTLLRRRGWRIYELPTLAVVVLMLAAEVLQRGAGRTMQARIDESPISPMFLLLALLLMAVLAAEVIRAVRTGETGQSVESVAGTMFAALYIGLLTVFIVGVRFLPSGVWGLLTWLAVAKSSDIGGYAVGMAFGRHKMTPRLSPGKTVEGLFGSLLLSVGVSLGLGTAWLGLEIWQTLVFGLAICGTAILGDLAESLVKRATDSKDSSRMIPGFGGVLDIMDSILYTAPAAFVLLVTFAGSRPLPY
jgi:phosphatidate cytidylyltransferase